MASSSSKFVCVIAVMVMLLVVGIECAESKCTQACYDKCKGTTLRCLIRCLRGCPGSADVAHHQHYCKLACTYDLCLKHGNDKSKMRSCVNNCENVKRYIKPAASLSPSPGYANHS